ncbi:uncharacterized protein [Linepithema humile]|uniref:uncharacterized protein n=1 Tax=Linepithema humile TaxID=83485 RepID=UPI0006238894|nr:PREDICTED: zinc finger protein 468-like [Linepithema humile]XP_012223631.1 PREDICTED: zinc finger protein 468-like [Linepithema humile]
MLPSSVLDLTSQISKKIIQQLIQEIIMKRNNKEMEHRHYTQQNTEMPQGTAQLTPDHLISNSKISSSNAVIYPSQIPKNIPHEPNSHIFPLTFNNQHQLITSNKSHETVEALIANDADVSSNKVSQNRKNQEAASIKQLAPNRPQTLTQTLTTLNSHVSERDSMSMSAPKLLPSTSVNENDKTDTECIRKCNCTSNCNNTLCNIKIRHSSNSKHKFECSVKKCQKSFRWKSHLEIHMRSHTGKKPYVCTWENCGKKFSVTSDLNRHKRVHTGGEVHTCKICFRKYSKKSNLERHKKHKHYMYK